MALSHEEWRKLTNLIEEAEIKSAWPSPVDRRDFRFAAFRAGRSLPKEFRRDDELPPVGDQGRFGTCVSWAAGHGQKGWQERQQGDYPEGGLSPAFLYARCKARDGLAAPGTYPRVALQVLLEEGICSEKTWPYERLGDDVRPNQPPERAMFEAKQWRISGYARADDAPDPVEEVKAAIVEQGPVVAAVLVTQSFVDVGRGGVIPLPAGRVLGGHAVVLAGYSDKVGAFRLYNSWGRKWGQDGWHWLPYEFVTYRIDVNGRGYLPAFFEAWAALDLPYPIRRAGKIILRLGEQRVWVDGEEFGYDVPPFICQGRAMIPVRLVAERLGCVVNWQASTGVVEIVNPAKGELS